MNKEFYILLIVFSLVMLGVFYFYSCDKKEFKKNVIASLQKEFLALADRKRILDEHGAYTILDDESENRLQELLSLLTNEFGQTLLVQLVSKHKSQDTEEMHFSALCGTPDFVLDYVIFLINISHNINTFDIYGKNALHYQPDQYVTEALIRNGVDINAQDKQGYTPFYSALSDERWKRVHYMLTSSDWSKLDITLKPREYGLSALQHILSGLSEACKELMEFDEDELDDKMSAAKEKYLLLTEISQLIFDRTFPREKMKKNKPSVNFSIIPILFPS